MEFVAGAPRPSARSGLPDGDRRFRARGQARHRAIDPGTVATWRNPAAVEDSKAGPKDARSTGLAEAEDATIAAFRRHMPLDDCLHALRPSVPYLTRSALHRHLRRRDISRPPDIGGDTPKRQVRRHAARRHAARGPSGSKGRAGGSRTSARGRPHRIRTDRRWHPAASGGIRRHPAASGSPAAPQPEHGTGKPDALRDDPRGERNRTSPDRAEPSMDRWPARADEPKDRGCEGDPIS